MASAEHEPIMGVWGRAPSGVQGQSPWSGGQRAKAPEAESILAIGCPTEPANLAPVRENSMLCYGPLVSELGGRVHGAPTPSLGGLCPRPPGSAAYGPEDIDRKRRAPQQYGNRSTGPGRRTALSSKCRRWAGSAVLTAEVTRLSADLLFVG